MSPTISDNHRLRDNIRRTLLGVAAALVLTAALAGRAAAANQFTLDRQADSMGPVVTDLNGNGYVAWLHRSGAGDVDMFCKLSPGARTCSHPITLPVTLADSSASTDTPFPVLGPGSDVFVVAPSYDTSQDVMWESTDGGTSFGAAYVGPTNPILANGLKYTDTCNVASGLDDVVPFNAYGGEYDRSQGTSTLSSNGIEYEMSSSDPFAMWSFDFFGSGCYVDSSITVTPGRIPAQWFNQGGGGSGDFGVGTDDSTLGWAGGGTVSCPLNDGGDEVQAYENSATSEQIKFFRYSSPTGPCSTMGNFGPGGSDNWSGPYLVTVGQYPRLAGGKGGLFLLSGDDPSASGAPTAIDVRRYLLSSHSFAPAYRLARVRNPSGLDPDSGGLGENYTSGELAAVWPDVAGDDQRLALYISTDDGAHFSAGDEIAKIGFGYAGADDARVAVASNGTGWVTWQDAGGLHVANLEPLGGPYQRLQVAHGVVEVPVTCEAPKHYCRAHVELTHGGAAIGSGERHVPSGGTRLVLVALNGTGTGLLTKRGHRTKATLTLRITHAGATDDKLVVRTLLIG
jgi:hypothetical protein